MGLIVAALTSSLVICALSLDINTYAGTALLQLEAASARWGSNGKTCVSVASPDELHVLFDSGTWSTTNRLGIGTSAAPGDVSTCTDRVKSRVGTDMLLAHAHALKFASEYCDLDGVESEYVDIANNVSQAALLGYRVGIHETVVFKAVQKLSSCQVPTTCSALYPDIVPNTPEKSSLHNATAILTAQPQNNLRIECGTFSASPVHYDKDWERTRNYIPVLPSPSRSGLLQLCISQFSVDSAARRGALGVPVPKVAVAYSYEPIEIPLQRDAGGTSRGALALAGARVGFSLWCLAPTVLFASFVATYFTIFFVRITTSEVDNQMSGITDWIKSFSFSAALSLLLIITSLRVYFVWLPMSSTQAPSLPYCETDGSGWRSFGSATRAEVVSTIGYFVALALPVLARYVMKGSDGQTIWITNCRNCTLPTVPIFVTIIVSVLYTMGITSEAILGHTIGSAWATAVSSSSLGSKTASLRLALMIEERARSALSLSATTGMLLGAGAGLSHMSEYKRNHVKAFRALTVVLVLAALIPLANVPSLRAIFRWPGDADVDNCSILHQQHHFALCEWQWVVTLVSGFGIVIVAVGVSAVELITSRQEKKENTDEQNQLLDKTEMQTESLMSRNILGHHWVKPLRNKAVQNTLNNLPLVRVTAP